MSNKTDCTERVACKHDSGGCTCEPKREHEPCPPGADDNCTIPTADCVAEPCRLYMADFDPDDGGEPCLGVRGKFESVTMADKCWLVRLKGVDRD